LLLQVKKAESVTHARNAKTLTPSHLKQCIMAEQRFDFLKDVVSSIPDVQGDEDAAETPTPRSAVSNSSFVFPASSTATSTASSSSAPQLPTSSGAPSSQSGEPTTPSYASELPDQKPNFGTQNMGGGIHHPLPLTVPPQAFPSRSVHSTINPSVPVIVPNPSVIQQQQHLLNPVGVNNSPYIPSVSNTSHSPSNPGGQYAMYQQHHLHLQQQQQQHSNPNGIGMAYGSAGMNEPVLSYGIRGADGSLGSANSAMMNSMYDQKNSPISYHHQYHHQAHHPNQYHSQ